MGTNENEWQGALSAIDLSAIEALKKLKQEHDQLSERLKSMEAMKSNFADAVYVRVRADYEKRIAALDAEAAPLKQAAREQYKNLRALLARFEADHEAVKLDRDERPEIVTDRLVWEPVAGQPAFAMDAAAYFASVWGE